MSGEQNSKHSYTLSMFQKVVTGNQSPASGSSSDPGAFGIPVSLDYPGYERIRRS